MASKSIKGYAFEYFVRNILNACGFASIIPDDKITYNAGAGTMIHGLGQPHNADVLVNPPIQIPFYYSSRLLVECKCYEKSLGLSFVRNVLGLREDVNSFEVVDEQILKARRNNRRTVPALYDYERYVYQVTLASISGFKKTTQEFADVHKIPLISYQSSIFAPIVTLINKSDQLEFESTEKKQAFIKILQGGLYDEQINLDLPWLFDLNEKINTIAKYMRIGILDNGTLLFMYKSPIEVDIHSRFYDGFTLHWSASHSYWVLKKTNQVEYNFELPQKMLALWANANGSTRKERALDLKQQFFRNIVVYEKRGNEIHLETLKLSQDFIDSALSELNVR